MQIIFLLNITPKEEQTFFSQQDLPLILGSREVDCSQSVPFKVFLAGLAASRLLFITRIPQELKISKLMLFCEQTKYFPDNKAPVG